VISAQSKEDLKFQISDSKKPTAMLCTATESVAALDERRPAVIDRRYSRMRKRLCRFVEEW